MLTGQQIVTDIIALLRETGLPSFIGGGVYREGNRPRDSRAEDLVVIFTTADAEQFQSGVVTLNIYVPDLPETTNGVGLVDSARCEAVEAATSEAISSLKAHRSDYLFRLRDAVHTERDQDTGQAFVVARLGFKHIV